MKRIIFIALAVAGATFLCKYLFCEEIQQPVESAQVADQTTQEEEEFLKFLKQQLSKDSQQEETQASAQDQKEENK